MARPKKVGSSDMLQIVDSYIEKHGDVSKLKCSNLEHYAATLGIKVKAYDFRRDDAVRQRIAELNNSVNNESAGALVYKNIDANAFITNYPTRATLKAALLELDANWRRVYERSIAVSAENIALVSENNAKKHVIAELSDEISGTHVKLKALKHLFAEQESEIRYLRSVLETHLYPAIADELLRREGVPVQADTAVSETTMKAMTDADEPLPFSEDITPDSVLLSREQALLDRMKSRISERNKNAKLSSD